MNALNNIRIGTKLIGSFLFLALTLVGVALIGYFNMQTISSNLDTIYIDNLLPIQQLGQADAALSDIRGDDFEFIVDEQRRDQTEADIHAQIAKFEKQLDLYQGSQMIKIEEDALKIVNQAWSTYKAQVLEDVALVKAGKIEDVDANLSEGGKTSNAYKTVGEELDNLIQMEADLALKSDQDSNTVFDNSQNVLLMTAIIAVLLAIALGFILSNSITGPLQKGVTMMQEMSLGHLGMRLKMNRQDEIGILARDMDLFADDLQNMVVATLKKIADGDLSTDPHKKDDLDEIGPALMQITTSLRGLVSEAGMLTRAGVEGKLSIRGDASKFKGSYHEIVQGVNDTLDAVIGPLNVAAVYVDKIAAGVVPPPITDTYNGDFDTLKNNLNRMSDRLREMLSSISEAANNLSSATAEILAATTQQVSGASEQNAAISQTTTTVEEVKASSEQAAMRAQDVANASQRTVEVARAGQRSVQDTIESMGTIKERVEGISENLLALSDQTQQIGEIIAKVNEIASQSNMLALNASVEAARAGEHGKGFAVVATEVRSLAEQSRQATEQIKAILSEIQKATNSTVMATEEGVKGVDRGVQLSAQSREAIEQLSAVINESAQVAAQVVASGQQQQTGIDQISLAMQNINQVTMQGLSSTRQTEKSAQNLNELAGRLSEILVEYRF